MKMPSGRLHNQQRVRLPGLRSREPGHRALLPALRHGARRRPAHREERRVVSVLFVDIVGFTSRSEAARPGGRARVPDALLRARPERRSRRHGGRIEKFVGDAVLGIFGAPVAHGDDAERAVRTALAIRDDARRDERRRAASSTSSCALAVNTGEVIVDLDARPEAGETMVVGDVVNTAARLQSAAPRERDPRRARDVRGDAHDRRVRAGAAGRREGQGRAGRGRGWPFRPRRRSGERSSRRRRSSAARASSTCSRGSGRRSATSAGRTS